MLKKILISIIILVGFLSTSIIVMADDSAWLWDDKIVDTLKWSDRDLVDVINSFTVYLLSFVAFIAIVYWIFWGFFILTAWWDDDKVKKGKNILLQLIYWIIIISSAWMIIYFTLWVLWEGTTKN